jgi:hypothetical protein
MGHLVAGPRISRSFLVGALFALFSAPAFSRTLCGITGRVTDSSTAAVPGAVITLTSAATNAVRTTASTDAGDYAFPSVPPGFYSVQAEHRGVKIAAFHSVEVQVQQTVRPDLTLEVGQLTESVSAEAAADLPQAENSRWLNPAAFVEAVPGFFGNVGRNAIEGPGIADLDAEAHKQFKMPYNEHHSFQFRAEAFNSSNHPNLGMPNLNILSGAAFAGQPGTNAHQGFGVVSGTSTSMRQMQVGVEVHFLTGGPLCFT